MRYPFSAHGQTYQIDLDRTPDGFRARVDGQPHVIELLDDQPGQLTLRLNGRRVTLYWAVDGPITWVSLGGCTFRLEKPAARRASRAGESDGSQSIHAPMPAQVRAVLVEPGDAVEKGQTLLLLEAMKMEIRVKSPLAGRVTRLLVAEGQTIDRDQPLAEIETSTA